MVDDGEETEPGQPIGIDNPALVDRLDGRTPFRGHEHPVPFHAASPRITEPCHDMPGYGPREFPAQLPEGAVGIDGVPGHRLAQFVQEFFESRLLAAQLFQALRPGVGFRLQVCQHHGAVRACLLDFRELSALLLFQFRQLLVLRGELGIEFVQARHVGLDGMDLFRALPPKITVVDEHPTRAGRILLVEEQLQRLPMAY